MIQSRFQLARLSVLGVLVLMGTSSCKVAITANVDGSPATVPGITVTPNFDNTRPTGWLKPDTSAIAFTIAATNGLSASSFECRAGLKTLIAAQVYSDCSGGTFTPSPTGGRTNSIRNDNGTYTIQVRALDASSAVLASASVDFYVHPDLDSVATCPDAFTDNQYFQAAASILAMTTPFGAQTSLEGPFYDIEFARGPTPGLETVVNLRRFVSLRKKVVANGNNTLMLVKQDRLGTSSTRIASPTCHLLVPTLSQGTRRYVFTRAPDGGGGYLNNEVFQHAALSTSYGLGPQSAAFGPHFTDPFHYGIMSSTGKAFTTKSASHGSYYSADAWNEAFATAGLPSNVLGSRQHFECSAMVFNAMGKGVCFRMATLANPVPLRSVATLFGTIQKDDPADQPRFVKSRSRRMSNEKLVNDGSNTYWNAWAAANVAAANALADAVQTLNP